MDPLRESWFFWREHRALTMTGQSREDIPAAPPVGVWFVSFPVDGLNRLLSQAADKKWESCEKGKISWTCLGHAERTVFRNGLKEETKTWVENIFRHSWPWFSPILLVTAGQRLRFWSHPAIFVLGFHPFQVSKAGITYPLETHLISILHMQLLVRAASTQQALVSVVKQSAAIVSIFGW